MVQNMKRLILFLGVLLFSVACGTSQNKQQNSKQNERKVTQKQKNKRKNGNEIPEKAYEVWRYVKQNGRAMDGYVGGRKFGNYENRLPKKEDGQKVNYQEWDINPKLKGKNRGAERLVTSSTGKGYFTRDHYNSFVELKE